MKRTPSVVVIGAGMTGILAVIKLKKAGITDIIVLEKKENLGGTWRENTYPGVACDVPSHMYTYEFEPNPDWSSFFAHGGEIQQYFEKVAEKYQVYPYIRFNEAVTEAHYEDGSWQLTSPKGNHYQADFVICATGILHHPAFPDIPGLETFEGNMFHTASWDHSVPMDSSQKVGIIGTGSTAAQAIPEMVDTGAKVKVFQRTPQWVLPLGNFKFSNLTKKLARRWPAYQYLLRKIPFWFLEHVFTKAVTGRPFQKWLLSFLCKTNLKLSIKDKDLRKKLTPDYQVGCKRVIINKTFYTGIQKPNATLVTDGIKEITAKGVVTQDGTLHELDTLVLSTGFNPVAFMRPMNLTGKNGLKINDAWKNKIRTYRSILLKNFPNFFLMLGPNTPIGNFSVIAMSEVQLDYILKLIDKWRDEKFDSVEPQQQAIECFSEHVKQGLKNTTWVAGCRSWYLDSDGDPILWPYTWQQWLDEMDEPQLEDLIMNKYSSTNETKCVA